MFYYQSTENFVEASLKLSGSWEFSGEFKAFNHARGRGLWSTRTAEGRTGGVECVVALPQNVFPSLQLSAVWRVAKTYTACLYLIMLDEKKFTKSFWLLLFHCCLLCL